MAHLRKSELATRYCPVTKGSESETVAAGKDPTSGADYQQQHAQGVDGLTLENARLSEQVRIDPGKYPVQ